MKLYSIRCLFFVCLLVAACSSNEGDLGQTQKADCRQVTACEEPGKASDPVTLPETGESESEEGTVDSSDGFFYQQNGTYSKAFLRNLLEEKRDIRLQVLYQREKREANRELRARQKSYDEQDQVVNGLQDLLQKLKQQSPTPDSEIQATETQLAQALADRRRLKKQRDEAQVIYDQKAQNFADHTASVKNKVDELLQLENLSDRALARLYETL